MKRSYQFIGLTFLISWVIAMVLYFTLGSPKGIMGSLILVVYMFVPMSVTLFLQKGVYKESLDDLGISWKFNKWWLVAWLGPVVFTFAVLGAQLLFPFVEYTPDLAGFMERMAESLTQEQLDLMETQLESLPIPLIYITLIQVLIAGPTINAMAGFGEELGWRGFLHKEWKHWGFYKMSLAIGFVWGIWHAPIILMGHNYPEHPVLGVLLMTIWCILLSPIFTFIRIKSKSVIAAAILHGSLNAAAGLPLMLISGGNDLQVGVSGLAGGIVLVVVNVAVYFWWRNGGM